jgi:hypothetical protein
VVRILKRLLLLWATIASVSAAAAVVVKMASKQEDDPAASRFSLVTVFDGTEFRPVTKTLASSRAVTIFGGCQLDLRRSGVGEGDIRLELITVFGGTDVTVPDTWRVTVTGASVLGGQDVRVSDPELLPGDAPRLTIVGRTVMGGLRVQARPVLSAAANAE